MSDNEEKMILITGGAGFIGANLADRLLSKGERVIIFDNISRPGVERNLAWLRGKHRGNLLFMEGDVRDREAIARAVRRATFVFHLAAQVAVTSSVGDPQHDFSVNAAGTLNVLEAIRASPQPPPIVYTSTNKVYGDLAALDLRAARDRYEPAGEAVRRLGIGEEQPLSFHSPYGCSKGTADQYVLDYARTYGLAGVVFRMSCIYGPRQFGTEDQGWLAHFMIKALNGEPITLYGDGRQVRDVLYIDDLVNAFLSVRANVAAYSGEAFNIGGGPGNATSLREVLKRISEMRGREVEVEWEEWRIGDQRYYVSNISRFGERAGWAPSVALDEGLVRLCAWLSELRQEDASRYATQEKL